LFSRTLPAAVAIPAAIAIAALVGIGVTSCAPDRPGFNAAPSPTAAATIDNCGFTFQIPAPPKRIITVKSTSTEMLLALGLGNRIIGQAFPDGPVPAEWADAAKNITVISEFAPSQEAVLALNPDFIYAGWESNLAPDTAGDRSSLAKLGIGTYVDPSACKEPNYQPKKLTFDEVFSEITQAGQIFGAQDAAASIVTAQKKQLATIPADTRGLSALWYSSGDKSPYVGAGIGAPEMMLEKLGLKNVIGDVKDTWTSASWEAVAAANPSVIILVDATWNTAVSKIKTLETNPVTSKLDAVKNKRYLIIPFAASEAGVRDVAATADLSAQLSKITIQ
jgi:iron complex transport system substrate-binding protein